MKQRVKWRMTVFLALLSLVVHIFSRNADRVEAYYSTSVFPILSKFFRLIFGWLPFSIGDILYGALIVYLIVSICKYFIKKRFKKRPTLNGWLRTANMIFIIYITFNVLWGINYNRQGIASQLGLDMKVYSKSELEMVSCELILKVNSSKQALIRQNASYPDNNKLFKGVDKAYANLSRTHPFLKYDQTSLKPSMWGWFGKYAGFGGYYNPFSAEAQVNTYFPKFLQPFTACHEVAHQIGYGKEMEANFVGYLAAKASDDTLFHYSVYLDLFIYANRSVLRTDSVTASIHRSELLLEVENDVQQWIAFSRKHRNPVEPVIRYIYGVFLKQNEQPQGMMSYDEVTAFLIAYYRKYGSI